MDCFDLSFYLLLAFFFFILLLQSFSIGESTGTTKFPVLVGSTTPLNCPSVFTFRAFLYLTIWEDCLSLFSFRTTSSLFAVFLRNTGRPTSSLCTTMVAFKIVCFLASRTSLGIACTSYTIL